MEAKKGLEELEPLFGDARLEWEQEEAAGKATLSRPFLFHFHPLDPYRLEIVASDFCSHTWERILTVQDLEDMRDDIGVGGSSSEFVDYMRASFSSDDVKLVVGGQSKDATESGATSATLVARKSKGMPRISLSLNRLTNSSAGGAMANLSLALYTALKNQHKDVVKEQERCLQLTRLLSSEKDRSESLQKQLDGLSFLSRKKIAKLKASDKAVPSSDTPNNSDPGLDPDAQKPPEMPSAKDSVSLKVNKPVVHAYHRTKVRGARLQDPEDDKEKDHTSA